MKPHATMIATILLGALAPATADCPADLDGDGRVDSADMGILLGAWGSDSSIADLDGDGEVTGADLALVLGFWGDCPDPPTCIGTAALGYETFGGGDTPDVFFPDGLVFETSSDFDCESPVLFASELEHCTIEYAYYSVSGANLSEICTAIFDPVTGAGPSDEDGRYAAYASGTFDVIVDCIDLPIEQDLPTAHPWWTTIRGRVTILLPEWTDVATASEADAFAWFDWLIELQEHELEHARIFDRMIEDMLVRHHCKGAGLDWCLPTEIPMPTPALGTCTVGGGTSSAAAIEISETVTAWLKASSDYTDMMDRQRALDAATDHGPSLPCGGGS